MIIFVYIRLRVSCLMLVEILNFMFLMGELKNLVMMVLISVKVVLILRLLKMNGMVIGRCSFSNVVRWFVVQVCIRLCCIVEFFCRFWMVFMSIGKNIMIMIIVDLDCQLNLNYIMRIGVMLMIGRVVIKLLMGKRLCFKKLQWFIKIVRRKVEL